MRALMTTRTLITLASFLENSESWDANDSSTEFGGSIDGSRLVSHSSSVTVVDIEISSRRYGARECPLAQQVRGMQPACTTSLALVAEKSHGFSQIRLMFSHSPVGRDF